jgi:NADPH:quinone reductase-like Zn-dependent oxidoreductase
VGTFAVQLAVARGAIVTGVCSTRSVELVKSLGAAEVIDYLLEDFAGIGASDDVVLDLVGIGSCVSCAVPLRRTARVHSGGGNPGEGSYLRPVIERTYALADAAAAIRHLEVEHARGKIVGTV